MCSVFLGCHYFWFLLVDRAKIHEHTHILIKSYYEFMLISLIPIQPHRVLPFLSCSVFLFSFVNSKIYLLPHLLRSTIHTTQFQNCCTLWKINLEEFKMSLQFFKTKGILCPQITEINSPIWLSYSFKIQLDHSFLFFSFTFVLTNLLFWICKTLTWFLKSKLYKKYTQKSTSPSPSICLLFSHLLQGTTFNSFLSYEVL